jgi:hypothetical protein
VERDRRDDHRGGARGGDQRDDVGVPLEVVRLRETAAERQCQQEREEDLHAGLGDPQLLEKIREVAVPPLLLGLVMKPLFGRHFALSL